MVRAVVSNAVGRGALHELVSSLSAWPTASTFVRRTHSGHRAFVFLAWASR